MRKIERKVATLRTLSLRCVAVNILSFAALTASAAADELPSGAEDRLNEILSQSEFQPRGRGQSYLEKLLLAATRWLSGVSEEIMNALNSWLPGKDSWLGNFLNQIRDLLNAVAEVLLTLARFLGLGFWLLLGLIIIYLVYRIHKYFLQRSGKELGVKDKADRQPQTQNFKDIIALGVSQEALFALRDLLRAKLLTETRLPTSLTDRELGRRVSQEHPLKSIFKQLSGEFERIEYAGLSFRADNFAALLTQYEAAAKEGGNE